MSGSPTTTSPKSTLVWTVIAFDGVICSATTSPESRESGFADPGVGRAGKGDDAEKRGGAEAAEMPRQIGGGRDEGEGCVGHGGRLTGRKCCWPGCGDRRNCVLMASKRSVASPTASDGAQPGAQL